MHREDPAAGVLRGEGGAWPGLGWTARQRGVPSHGVLGGKLASGTGLLGAAAPARNWQWRPAPIHRACEGGGAVLRRGSAGGWPAERGTELGIAGLKGIVAGRRR